MCDDSELIARAKSGDRIALEELFTACRRRLREAVRGRLGKRLRAHIEVDDVVQTTFLRAAESLARFVWRGQDSFQHWLFGIAKNLIRENARLVERIDEIHEVQDNEDLDGVICDAPSAATLLRQKDRFVRAVETLDGLRPEHAEVIRLALIERLPLKEVAFRMRRSHGGVRNLVRKAVKRFRAAFGDTDSLTVVVPSSRSLRALRNGK